MTDSINGLSSVELNRVTPKINSENQMLANVKKDKSPENIRKVAKEFESLFVTELMSAMRKTVDKSNLFGEPKKQDLYREMLDVEMGKQIARGSGIGIAKALERELTGKFKNTL